MKFFKGKLAICLSSLLLSLVILVACKQTGKSSIPKPDSESTVALFDSAELARAKPANITSVIELAGKDLNNEEINIEPIESAESVAEQDSNLIAQSVLPTASGIVAYYGKKTGGSTYRIWTLNQVNGIGVSIYSSIDEVQSVAVTSDGNLVVASIKNPAHGFFDVYVFDTINSTIVNLSNTDGKDELDVSITADGTKIVWSGPSSNDLIKVNICDYDLTA